MLSEETDMEKNVQPAFQEATRQALTELVPKIREELRNDLKAAEARRRQRYYERLDPELMKFREALNGQGLGVQQRKRLDTAYQTKVATLEALRVVERALTEREQQEKKQREETKLKFYKGGQRPTEDSSEEQHYFQPSPSPQQQPGDSGVDTVATLASTFGGRWGQLAGAALKAADAMSKGQQANAAPVPDKKSRYVVASYIPSEAGNSHFTKYRAEFAAIRGDTREEIRSQWLAKYRNVTPDFDQALGGPPHLLTSASASNLPSLSEGAIEVVSDPAGADLYVNGDYFGSTPSSTLRFPLGTQITVQVKRPGYKDFERKLMLSTSNVLRLNALMEAE